MTGANEHSAAAGGLLTNSKHQRTLELNEAQARYILIDPELRRAGWKLDDHTQVLREVPVLKKFAALVERYERLRVTQREALRQAEHLFQTLLHQAFCAQS